MKNEEFTLEALEPRLLLSADGMLAYEPAPIMEPIHEVVLEESIDDFAVEQQTQNDSITDFTSNDQIVDLFDGADEEIIGVEFSEVEHNDSSTQNASNVNSSTTQLSIDNSVYTSQTNGSVSPDYVNESSLGAADMLVETLTGSQGPPADNIPHEISTTYSPGNSPGDETDPTDYTPGPDSRLLIEIGGTEPGWDDTNHDRVNFTTGIELGGTLDVEMWNNFEPSPGDSFEIITAPSITGDFDSFTGLAVPNGLILTASIETAQNGTDDAYVLTTSATPTPTLTNTLAAALRDGVSVFDDAMSFMEDFGDFAQNLALLESGTGDNSLGYFSQLSESTNAFLADPIASLLPAELPALLPTQSDITAALQNIDPVLGFTITVNNATGEYGALPVYHLDITAERIESITLNLGSDTLLGAAFDGTTIELAVVIDFALSFGLQTGSEFFVDNIDINVAADLTVDSTDMGLTFGDLGSSVSISDGQIHASASVGAQSTERITFGTLQGIDRTFDLSTLFNFEYAGALDEATLTASTDISGFEDFTLSGTTTFSLTIADLFDPSDIVFSISVSDAELTVLNQTIEGNFLFTAYTGDASAIANLATADGQARIIFRSGASEVASFLFSGNIIITDSGIAAQLTVALADAALPQDITVTTASIELQVNTTGTNITGMSDLDVQAGEEFVRVRISGDATVYNQDFSGTFDFEQQTIDSVSTSYITLEDVTVAFRDPDAVNPIVSIETNGQITITENGLLANIVVAAAVTLPDVSIVADSIHLQPKLSDFSHNPS